MAKRESPLGENQTPRTGEVRPRNSSGSGLSRSESTGQTETGRRAKFYELTVAGRQRLSEEQDSWQQYSDAVQHVIASRS